MPIILSFIWAIAFIICSIGEFITQELICVWFLPGELIALILAACGVELWIQLVVFAVVSLICLLLLRTIVNKFLIKKDSRSNLDLIIGEKYTLSKAVTEDENGELKREGIVWTAVSEDGKPIKEGTVVVVKAIKGNKLIVKKEIE